MPKILCVCTANRCRSPMAMAMLRHLLIQDNVGPEYPQHQPNAWHVSSAGTWAVEGLPAMSKTISVMREIGLNVEDHRSRSIDLNLLSEQDLILVMEAGHREALALEFPHVAERTHLLSAMAGPAFDIKDPVTGTIADYRDTARLLHSLLTDGLPTIKQHGTSG